MNVAAVAVIVNTWLVDQHRFIDGRDRFEWLIFDFDQIHRIESDVFIDRSNRSNGIADESHFIDAECVLILTDGQDAVRNRKVFSRDNSKNAGQRQRFGNVDTLNQRVRQV